MEPPLFIWEPNNLEVFISRQSLEDYVEVPDVNAGTAYDSDGRLLRLRVENDRIVVEDAEPVATHQSDLADALRQALRATNADFAVDAPLRDLVRLALQRFG
jgi:hypothetical protein